MNYKVLYRKYRPSNFNEMVGQKKTIDLLKESVVNNKIAHAYIFSGPRGTGKTSTAKIFAKTVNCLNPVDGNPCGECEKCKNFGTSSDVYEIDAASNNGVDQIREIIDNIKLAPISSKYKVYIIDEVHMLSSSAFNALLLTLEEPPSHVIFILATTDIEDVPITVLSRCQRMEFRKISDKDIEGNLRKISDLENIEITDEAIQEIAVYSDGGMRDALSILDQMSKENKTITEEDILANIGLISTQNIINLLDMIEKSQINEISNFIEDCSKNAYDIKTFIKKLIIEIKNREILIKNGKFQTNLSYSLYKKLAFELADLLWKNNVNLDTYILLELLLLDFVPSPENTENMTDNIFEKNNKNIEEILNKNIEKTEEKNNEKLIIDESLKQDEESNLNISDQIVKIDSKNLDFISKLVDVRVNNCFAGALKKYKEKNSDIWHNYLLHENSRKIKGLLSDTQVVLSSDSIIVLEHSYQENVDEINKNIKQIENLFNNFNDSNYKLICITTERWRLESEKFLTNREKNIKYSIQSEPSEDEDNILNDVFLDDKIEII